MVFESDPDGRGWDTVQNLITERPLSVNHQPNMTISEGKHQPSHLYLPHTPGTLIWCRLIIPALVLLKNPITQLFQMRDTSPKCHYCNDYNRFMVTEASLMCLMMLSEADYETDGVIPPHRLHFDCSGSITLEREFLKTTIEGGEITSSLSAKLSVGAVMCDILLTVALQASRMLSSRFCAASSCRGLFYEGYSTMSRW